MVKLIAEIRRRLKKVGSTISLWLTPGIGIKRWVLVVLAGTTFIALGFAVVILDLYRETDINWLRLIFNYISLSTLPRWLRALIFGGTGILILSFGLMELNRSILKPFLKPGQPVIDTLTDFRRRARGPRIVAIGGGHGLASLLRGLKKYTHN